MTCSLEREAQWYWTLMRDLRRLQRAGGDPQEIAHAIDEIEVLSLYTDSPVLRKLCVSEVSSYVRLDATAS